MTGRPAKIIPPKLTLSPAPLCCIQAALIYVLLNMSGLFITFEGIEGSGKTTQVRMLADYLKKKGQGVVTTREPGGTVIGDKIRAILLNAAHDGMSPMTELLLYAAARNQHIAEVIRPALDKRKIVLCDRYADATTAYQGAARKISPEIISSIHKIATGGLKPDHTILMDLPVETGLGRAISRNVSNRDSKKEDRFEREDLEFHRRVREGYLTIARAEPKRVVIIDARNDIETIHHDITMAADKFLDR